MTALTPPVAFRIRPTGNGTHELMINDVSVGMVATHVNLSMSAGRAPQVTITIAADEIDIDTKALLSVYMEQVE